MDNLTITELRELCHQSGLEGYSKLKKRALLELLSTIPPCDNPTICDRAADVNRTHGRVGKIALDKLPGRSSKTAIPMIPGYLSINVCSSSKTWTKGLSPTRCGSVTHQELDWDNTPLPVASCVENLWQFCKVWPFDLDDNTLKKSYFKRKREGFLNPRGVRHPVKSVDKTIKPISTYYRGEFLSWIPARKKFYCPVYESSVIRTGAYQELEKLHQNGYNLLILDYDGYKTKDFTKAIHNEKKPFGHGHVLCCMLMNNRVWL